jgi:hypothetical protein
MIRYRHKAVFLIILGVTLIVLGVAASILAERSSARLIGSVCVIVGLVVIRLSNLPHGLISDKPLNLGERAWLDSFRSPRRPMDRLEYPIYGIATLLFCALIGSALMGYFSDILTFFFLGMFVLAIGLLTVRRIF